MTNDELHAIKDRWDKAERDAYHDWAYDYAHKDCGKLIAEVERLAQFEHPFLDMVDCDTPDSGKALAGCLQILNETWPAQAKELVSLRKEVERLQWELKGKLGLIKGCLQDVNQVLEPFEAIT